MISILFSIAGMCLLLKLIPVIIHTIFLAFKFVFSFLIPFFVIALLIAVGAFLLPIFGLFGWMFLPFLLILLAFWAVKKVLSFSGRACRSGSSTRNTSYSSGSYVLNKKTGVIHDIWSDSADQISEKHRKVLDYSEAMDYSCRGGKYHFKNDP